MGDCLAEWCADADYCGVTCAADVVGRKWHPVVLHRLLDDGPQGFADLGASIPELSNTVLSDALDDLRGKELVERSVLSEEPFRVEYRLTERGESLQPVLAAMAEWGREHAAES
jgi:DNA-binding HxlR family transcriptional regulator